MWSIVAIFKVVENIKCSTGYYESYFIENNFQNCGNTDEKRNADLSKLKTQKS